MATKHQNKYLRHPEKTKVCEHCGDSFVTRAPNSIFCSGCVPRDDASKGVTWNRRIRWYGVSKKDWDTIFAKTNGICPICQTRAITDVEHCHTTGKVRGLVCTQCNKGLAFLDNRDWIERAKSFIAGELK